MKIAVIEYTTAGGIPREYALLETSHWPTCLWIPIESA